MKMLFEHWINEGGPVDGTEFVEPPPVGFPAKPTARLTYKMEHKSFGFRDDVATEEVEALRARGWRLYLSDDDFLQLIHIQAWYFQVRWFPRLAWKILDAPADAVFVTCDRPVVWGVDGEWDVPPAALRHRRAELIVPVSRSRALFAFNPAHDRLGPVSPNSVNEVMSKAAHAWIAGPTREVVEHELSGRTPDAN